jgi:integrase
MRQRAAQSVSLREVADAYMADRPLKASSKSEIERHVTTTFAAWLNKPIASITREAVTKRFNEVKSYGLRGVRPAPSQANQGFAILRALVNYAIREYRKPDGLPMLPDNPTEVLHKKWVTLKPRKSRISDGKVGSVWSFLQDSRACAYNRDTLASIDLVIFLLLTGARIGTCSKWSEGVSESSLWLPNRSPLRTLRTWESIQECWRRSR